MLARIRELIANSRVVQFGLVLILGIGIGAVFYPTKHIEERLTQKHDEEVAKLKEEHLKSEEKVVDLYNGVSKEYREYKKESETKITQLTTQVTTLKSKQKTAYYKVVRPDGTVEVQKFSESEVDESTQVITKIQSEFKEKVSSIERKWSEIHQQRVLELKRDYELKEQEYKKTIDQLEKTKVVDINKKSFGIEAGAMVSGNYYGHVTYDLFGPFIVGGHGQFGLAPSAGAGIGLRF